MLTHSRNEPTLPEADSLEKETSPAAVLPIRAIVIGSFLLTVVLAIGLASFWGSVSYDALAGSFIGVALFLATLPALSRLAKRERDRRLFWLLFFALMLHLLLSATAGHILAFNLYHGNSDAADYHRAGVDIAAKLRNGNFNTGLHGGVFGTNFPSLLNGIFYAIFGVTSYGAFLFYAWLGFWGLLYCYRAFRLALPEGASRTYAKLIFFLPSQTFWSSFMGKDAWMVFGLGIAVFGVARVLSGKTWRGLGVSTLGMALMAMIRPHVAAMVAVALAAGFLVRRSNPRLRQLGPLAKVLAAIVVTAVAVVFLRQTQHFLREQGVTTNKGLTRALEDTSQGGSYGGSAYIPPIVSSPKDLPKATITVLFRPFITEAGSALEKIAALETAFLLLLSLIRIRWIWTALKSIRRWPFIAFAFAYVGMYIIAFSSFANFGLLDRQRAQLLPIYAILLAVPPKVRWFGSTTESESLTSQRST